MKEKARIYKKRGMGEDMISSREGERQEGDDAKWFIISKPHEEEGLFQHITDMTY